MLSVIQNILDMLDLLRGKTQSNVFKKLYCKKFRIDESILFEKTHVKSKLIILFLD